MRDNVNNLNYRDNNMKVFIRKMSTQKFKE